MELKSRAARKRKEAENPAKYAAEYARSLQIAAAHLAKQAEQAEQVQPSPDCKRRRKCDSVAEALSDVLGGAVPPGVRLRGTPAHLEAQLAGLCRFLRGLSPDRVLLGCTVTPACQTQGCGIID